MKANIRHYIAVAACLIAGCGTMTAHVQPPRVLMSDREAAQLLAPAARFMSAGALELAAEQRQAMKSEFGWKPEEKHYPVIVAKDERNRVIGTVIFVSDITLHGLVRTAVLVDPDGNIKGAVVTAVTEENFVWVKQLMDENFAQDYLGKNARSNFLEIKSAIARRGSMVKFYGQVLASLLKRGAVLYAANARQVASL